MIRSSCRRLGASTWITLGALSVVGCGAEEFSDAAFGVMDLGPFFDGGTPTNPAAGVPFQFDPLVGYVKGEKVENYDFGFVPAIRDPFTGRPQSATVHPMYFFFDKAGNPLFSPPVRENRTGNDFMSGGVGVLEVNPINYCEGYSLADCPAALKEQYDAQQKRAYPIRARNLLKDANRTTYPNDFQRPVVDLFPGDIVGAPPNYTGLWEIHEVTVPDGYKPDSIKKWRTLELAIEDGGFKVRRTLKVINCPIIDERSAVARGVSDRRIFRPRIEIWYRQKLGYCHLANGWETLGYNSPPSIPGAPETPVLYKAGNDADRLDTFDVNRILVGDGNLATTQILVPLSILLEPAVIVPNQDPMKVPVRIRPLKNQIAEAKPRTSPADPPGYSPIRLLYDFLVADNYVPGAFTSVDQVDTSKWRFRDDRQLVNQTLRYAVRNIPTRGVITPCSFPKNAKGLCERYPKMTTPGQENEEDTSQPRLPDPQCQALQLECNHETCSCDAPAVGYGKVCGFGIARCRESEDAFSSNGYSCFPPSKGFCYIGCNIGLRNNDEHKNGEGKTYFDSRCESLPDYRCLGTRGTPSNHRFCLKYCDTLNNNPEAMQCLTKTQPPADPEAKTLKMEEADIAEGQECISLGLDVCVWPDGFDPKF